MVPMELFTYSMVAEETKALVKRLFKKVSFQVSIFVQEQDYSVSFGQIGGAISNLGCEVLSQESEQVNGTQIWKMDENTEVQMEHYYDGQICRSYWKMKKETEAILKVLDYLRSVFNVKEVSVSFSIDEKYDAVEFLKSVKNRGVQLKNVNITGFEVTLEAEAYKNLLNECTETSELNVAPHVNWGFEYPVSNFSNFCQKFLTIEHAHWVTVHHLKSLRNCASVTLNNSKLTNQNLNWFLREWMEMSGASLRNVDLEVKQLDLPRIINGLKWTIKEGIISGFGGFQKLPPGDCFEIQRIDGVKATISRIGERFLMTRD